jgi:CheY-like chemotaxis protein
MPSADVKVTLPLLRELPQHPESGSTNTPKSMNSAPESDESISKLRARVHGQRVSLHGFDTTSPDPMVDKMARLLKASVKNFVTEWYGMKVVPLGQKASIIISNEATSNTISELLPSYGKRPPSVVVLCSHTSRFDRMSGEADSKSNIGYVVKPVGPLKLGKAIAQCLEGVQVTTPNVLEGSPPETDLSNVFEEMSSNPKRGEVLDNSRMAADSDNARKALESPTPNALMEKGAEFPFPVAGSDDKKKAKRKSLNPGDQTPNPPTSLRISETIIHSKPSSPSFTQPTTKSLSLDTTPTPPKQAPSFLLVDDNAINLTLLSTSISKRANSAIDTAMDGLAAVKKFQEREEGYDIVFMDISMPLLDGFGATMEIRRIEGHRRDAAAAALSPTVGSASGVAKGITRTGTGNLKGETSDGKNKGGALVIALTGLASSDDQARALAVGVDLFLTKPVSFREVKKILDNWEANWGKESPS